MKVKLETMLNALMKKHDAMMKPLMKVKQV
jgi:hypothetical protein